MPKHFGYFVGILSLLACSLPTQAVTGYGVGGCNPKFVNFPTIQSAVNFVPAGTTIFICPGNYFEQVTISQPLTLRAATAGNSNRVVIALTAGVALTPNITSIDGTSFYAQVLVNNVNPPGPVNILGITVDGAGGLVDCTLPNGVAGIFYAPGTSGTVNEVTARNQQGCNLSTGIWAENSAGAPQSVIIENSSVRNIDGQAIVEADNQNPSTLAATIRGNFVDMQGVPGTPAGIWDMGAGAAISGNFITGGSLGIDNGGSPAGSSCCAATISSNTIADMQNLAVDIGIAMDSGSATQNQLSNVYIAFFTALGNVTISSNTSMNNRYEVDFNCSSGFSVSKNLFNDAQYAFYSAPSTIVGNKNFNIDTLQAGTCP